VIRHPFAGALALVVFLTFAGCTDGDGPTGVSGEASTLLGRSGGLLGTGLGSGLLACEPLPYAINTATIGPEGGTISVGPHVLAVPAGALSRAVVITAEAPVGRVNSVRLLPEGLAFAPGKPARLTLSYANCPLLGQVLPKRIAYTSDLLSILAYLLSVDDLLARQVSANLEHFSRYVVAW